MCSTAFRSTSKTIPITRRSSARALPEADQADIVAALRASRAEVMLNYLPVGSEEAVRFYAECALEAGVALVNCMPVFIASDPVWAQRFREAGLPLIGDDIKAQLGATITHRMLTDLFQQSAASNSNARISSTPAATPTS